MYRTHRVVLDRLTMKQMFDISEKLIAEQSDEMFGVSQISWEDSPWKQLILVSEEVISLSHAKVYVFSDSVLSLGKMHQNPQSNTVCEDKLTWFKSSSQYIQNTGHNRRRTDGIRVEYFPRILNIGACPRSPKVHEQYWRTRTIPRTDYLHVDVQ